MTVVTGIPTRSRVEGWTTAITELEDSAAWWRVTAGGIETAVAQYTAQLSAPGGTIWEGNGATAAQDGGADDSAVAARAATRLRGLSTVAEQGAQTLTQLRQGVLHSIASAEADGFTVTEQLGVKDALRYDGKDLATVVRRMAKAAEHRGYITEGAAALSQQDADLGTQLEAGATELDAVTPADWTAGGPRTGVQMLGGTDVPLGPPTVPPGFPAAPWDAPPAGQSSQTGEWKLGPTPYDSPVPPPPAPPPWRKDTNIPDDLAEGPTTGLLTTRPDGPQSGDAVGFDIQQGYQIRLSGYEYTGQTKMVQASDGKWYQAQWVSTTYEMQTTTVVKGTGDLGGLSSTPTTSEWKPVTVPQVIAVQSQYPGSTFYLPDGCGGTIPIGDEPSLGPVVPEMRPAPR